MAVNAGSIMSKLREWAGTSEGQQRMNSVIQSYVRGGDSRVAATGRTEGGSKIITYKEAAGAAEELISYIRQCAASCNLPASVMAHIESFQASSPEEHDGIVNISISMLDDPSRDSVQPQTYEGVYNIVALFNSGYTAKASVHGYWETADKDIWTLKHRDGLHFMQSAIERFNKVYGSEYNVTVFLSSEYE